MSKTTLHNSKASLKVRELKDEELNGVLGGKEFLQDDHQGFS